MCLFQHEYLCCSLHIRSIICFFFGSSILHACSSYFSVPWNYSCSVVLRFQIVLWLLQVTTSLFPKNHFSSVMFSQTNHSAVFEEVLKIKTTTRKKCSKSKVLFLTLFTEHQFWCHRIRFHVHSKNSLFEKRVVHFLTSCQKVNIAFFTLFQDFSVKCRIHLFSLACEVKSDSANPFM